MSLIVHQCSWWFWTKHVACVRIQPWWTMPQIGWSWRPDQMTSMFKNYFHELPTWPPEEEAARRLDGRLLVIGGRPSLGGAGFCIHPSPAGWLVKKVLYPSLSHSMLNDCKGHDVGKIWEIGRKASNVLPCKNGRLKKIWQSLNGEGEQEHEVMHIVIHIWRRWCGR